MICFRAWVSLLFLPDASEKQDFFIHWIKIQKLACKVTDFYLWHCIRAYKRKR